MRSGRQFATFALLLLALCAGCARKRHAVIAPPPAEAPSLPTPAQTSAMIPPLPPLPAYSPRPVILNTAVPPETSERSRHRIFRHHARPEVAGTHTAESAKSGAQATSAPQDEGNAASDASLIGQLSTATGGGSSADREDITRQIDSTENGLNAIKRPLDSKEQKTAAQIRTFVAHARDALKTNDLDGARTLAVKAHLLLQELTTP